MESTFIVLICLVILICAWMMVVFNALTAGRNNIKNAESGVEVQLRKRYDLVPNLVATVKGYAAHEESVLTRVTQLRQLAMQDDVPHHKHHADSELAASMKHLFAVAEAYPDLKADTHFLKLQAALNEIEAQLAAARRTYNATVTQYNNTVQSLPSNLVAGLFGFQVHRWFEIPDEARQVPQIADQM